MSETRYPAWWAKLQEDMAKSGCFEEGAPDHFLIVMHPSDYLECMDTALDAARKGEEAVSRLSGIRVFATKSAVRGHPTMVPMEPGQGVEPR